MQAWLTTYTNRSRGGSGSCGGGCLRPAWEPSADEMRAVAIANIDGKLSKVPLIQY